MNNKNFTEELLRLLPYWHHRIDKPLKAFMKDKMNLETYYCLQVLLRKGPMIMIGFTRHLNVSKQQITKLMEILCSRDFVRRLPTEHDRRYIVIEVTERAKDYMINAIYKDTSFADKLKQELGSEDMEQLEQAALILSDALFRLDRHAQLYSQAARNHQLQTHTMGLSHTQ